MKSHMGGIFTKQTTYGGSSLQWILFNVIRVREAEYKNPEFFSFHFTNKHHIVFVYLIKYKKKQLCLCLNVMRISTSISETMVVKKQ